MKNLLILAALCFQQATATAQSKTFSPMGPFKDLPNSYTKINTKAIVQKLGKDQILKLFNTTKVNNELKSNQKLALAALFNSAVDLEKPIWIKPNNNANESNYFMHRSINPIAIIPIKNKIKAVEYLKLITNAKEEIAATKKLDLIKNEVELNQLNEITLFKTYNNIIYFINATQNIIVDEKNIYIVSLYNQDLFNEFVPGKIISTDSTKYTEVVRDEMFESNSKNEASKNAEIVEIDKIENDIIVRVYQEKSTKFAEIKVDTAVTTIEDDTVTESFTAEVRDAEPVAAATIESPNQIVEIKKDNPSKYIRLENGVTAIYTYKPFSTKELVIQSKLFFTKKINSIISTLYKSVLYANEPLPESALKEMQINQLDEENADVVTIKKHVIGNIFSTITKTQIDSKKTSIDNDQAYSISVTNFENGKAKINQQFNCCDSYAQLTKDMFNPHTGDYLIVNNEAPLMSMAYNINFKSAKNYYEKIGLLSLFEPKLKIKNTNTDEFIEAFTGGIILSVNFEVKAPTFNLGLRVSDKVKAVALFNKLNSKNLAFTNFYRFSTDGKYLFLSVNPINLFMSKDGIMPDFSKWKIEENKNIGNLGFMQIDFNNLIPHLEKLKNESENNKEMTNAISLINSMNASINFTYKKNESGVLQTEGTINMGNNETNFLKSLVQLIEDLEKVKKN
jgi:hypothetical protein